MRGWSNERRQLLKHFLGVAVNTGVNEYVFVELAAVDVDVYDFSLRGKLGRVSGHAVAEAHANGNDEVAIHGGYVASYVAVHANHAHVEPVVGRYR